MDEEEALYWRIVELKKQYIRNQNIRTLLVIGGYAFFVFLFIKEIGDVDTSIKEIVPLAIVSIIIAGFIYFINCGIFLWKFSHNREENEELDYLEERYRELCRKRRTVTDYERERESLQTDTGDGDED